MKFSLVTLIIVACISITACDPEGRQKCQWTLEPEPKLIGKSMEGYIPACVRNRVTNKEDCRFQTTLDFAKRSWTKKFRYVDIDSDATKAPKLIRNIKFCE